MGFSESVLVQEQIWAELVPSHRLLLCVSMADISLRAPGLVCFLHLSNPMCSICGALVLCKECEQWPDSARELYLKIQNFLSVVDLCELAETDIQANQSELKHLKLLWSWTEKPVGLTLTCLLLVCYSSLAGPQECWLLTANRLQVVTAQVKVCLNLQCLALHSFTDIYTGRKKMSTESDSMSTDTIRSLGTVSAHCLHRKASYMPHCIKYYYYYLNYSPVSVSKPVFVWMNTLRKAMPGFLVVDLLCVSDKCWEQFRKHYPAISIYFWAVPVSAFCVSVRKECISLWGLSGTIQTITICFNCRPFQRG